jgi:phosphatidate cytidylyltransferase
MTAAKKSWQDLPRRLATIAIGAPTVFLMIYFGTPFYDVIVVGVSLLAAGELWHMIAPESRYWRYATPALMIVMVLGVAYGQYALILATLLIAAVIWAVVERTSPKTAIYMLIALLYIGIPLGVLLPARATGNGLSWTFVLFINNWTTDGFALIGGRLFGKTKLAPTISAAKTVEGAAIGLVIGTTLGFIATLVLIPSVPVPLALLVNILIAVLTEIGDLIESRVKRFFHIKDAGSLLPGHGGFLDRIDGLVVSIPVWVVFVMAFSGTV